MQRVHYDNAQLVKAAKHLRRARARHYHVVGLHRFYVKHYQIQRRLHHMRQDAGPSRLAYFHQRADHTGWKMRHWGVVRKRLIAKVAARRARWIGMKQWVQSVIAAQAAAQSQQASAILAELTAKPKKSGDGKQKVPAVIAGNGPGVVAVRAALTQLGVPYVWGGATPGKAFDCSGLTSWAWGQAGVSLVHFAATQATEGTPVSISQLQPGDLIFFESPIQHVVMYVGDGVVIEAPHTGDVVHLSRLDDSWYVENFQSAVRPG